ncbi:MAG: DUF615 domain-containing protein [Woeseiaceae bacterium]|nr:DUF615 domain-containing protein [Woeseiaceae bacterium]NIP20955.1 DUF615 domain-containing protein [Woeseiaceae bacterium]
MTESKPSKSERKREHLALQDLGESLIALRPDDLAALSLDDRLREAVHKASTMKSRGALRRQKQLIGKLMGDVDPGPIRAALMKLNADDVQAKRLFAKAEKWRDRLVRAGHPALHEFEAETGVSDSELRRQLVELDVCFDERTEKTLRRKIFRRVHEILGKIPQ